MPVFQYLGRTADGAISKGDLVAEEIADAFRLLKKRGIIPIKIEKAKSNAERSGYNFFSFQRRLKPTQVQYFCVQMATMLNAGLQVTRALAIIAGQKQNPRLQAIAKSMQRDVEHGKSLYLAATTFRQDLGDMLVNLIAAGEESGNVDTIFLHYAQYLEKRIKLMREIKGAMIYPAILFFIGIAVILLLAFYVLPRFADILDNNKFEMPAVTRIMLAASEFLRQNIFEVGLGIMVLLVVAGFILRQPRVQFFVDRLKFKLPFVKSLTSLAVTARLSRSMAMMLKSGLPFLKNLEHTIPIIGNRYAEHLLANMKNELTAGVDVHSTFLKIHFLPDLFLSLIEVGERSGKLDRMFEQAAEYYESELESKLKRAVQLFEPGMLLMISLFVGLIASALISTIMKAVQSFY
ncbi:MAG: type II secretion system F family protein [candidate division KSB1 bacterium]|nr:type II secretion system F family protein [candidate division KSB1 bacterium]